MSRLIELPDDGIVKVPMMRGNDVIGEYRYDLSWYPTIDAVPVVHARWIICSDGYYPYCSNCKQEPTGRQMTKYCDHCGAIMNEGENSETD